MALDFAAADQKTLVIVTGDHAHTGQIVESTATPAGFASVLVPDEGEPMQVSYGTGDTVDGRRTHRLPDPHRRYRSCRWAGGTGDGVASSRLRALRQRGPGPGCRGCQRVTDVERARRR